MLPRHVVMTKRRRARNGIGKAGKREANVEQKGKTDKGRRGYRKDEQRDTSENRSVSLHHTDE